MNTPIVSRSDLHLLRLLRASARLRKKLAAATVVPAQKVPAELVTMNSKVTYRDAMGAAKSVKLVYPSQADGVGCVSVMSPLGTALLGAAVGQELDVDIPGAGRQVLRVEDVISQPEREMRRPRLAASDAFSFSLGFQVDLYFIYGMVSIDMARLNNIFVRTHTGDSGAAARALPSRLLLTPGTLAFLSSAR